jgi:hypothetical protein
LEGGESLHEIGRAYGHTPSSIHLLLSHHGGIVPAVRRRSARALTLAEREDISRGIASGWSIREIATRLCRATSTVSWEVARHGGRSIYRASEADSQAWESVIPSATLDRHFHNRYRHFHTEKSLRTRNSRALIGYYSLQRKSNLPEEESS